MTTTSTITPIRPEEILDLGEYERRRDDLRASAIATRAVRRVALGPNATLSFENRETVRYQIQEMCRAERLAKPDQIAHEIETYSELLPTPLELSATLLFEFPEKAERDVRLTELLGFEQHFKMKFEDAGTASASFDTRQIDVERLSSVQFVRFAMNEDQRSSLASGKTVAVVSEHPRYAFEIALSPETARALASDLDEAQAMESANHG